MIKPTPTSRAINTVGVVLPLLGLVDMMIVGVRMWLLLVGCIEKRTMGIHWPVALVLLLDHFAAAHVGSWHSSN